jgi:hypothetical protein
MSLLVEDNREILSMFNWKLESSKCYALNLVAHTHTLQKTTNGVCPLGVAVILNGSHDDGLLPTMFH